MNKIKKLIYLPLLEYFEKHMSTLEKEHDKPIDHLDQSYHPTRQTDKLSATLNNFVKFH